MCSWGACDRAECWVGKMSAGERPTHGRPAEEGRWTGCCEEGQFFLKHESDLMKDGHWMVTISLPTKVGEVLSMEISCVKTKLEKLTEQNQGLEQAKVISSRQHQLYEQEIKSLESQLEAAKKVETRNLSLNSFTLHKIYQSSLLSAHSTYCFGYAVFRIVKEWATQGPRWTCSAVDQVQRGIEANESRKEQLRS